MTPIELIQLITRLEEDEGLALRLRKVLRALAEPPPSNRALYQREYMRKRRASAKSSATPKAKPRAKYVQYDPYEDDPNG